MSVDAPERPVEEQELTVGDLHVLELFKQQFSEQEAKCEITVDFVRVCQQPATYRIICQCDYAPDMSHTVGKLCCDEHLNEGLHARLTCTGHNVVVSVIDHRPI